MEFDQSPEIIAAGVRDHGEGTDEVHRGLVARLELAQQCQSRSVPQAG